MAKADVYFLKIKQKAGIANRDLEPAVIISGYGLAAADAVLGMAKRCDMQLNFTTVL